MSSLPIAETVEIGLVACHGLQLARMPAQLKPCRKLSHEDHIEEGHHRVLM